MNRLTDILEILKQISPTPVGAKVETEIGIADQSITGEWCGSDGKPMICRMNCILVSLLMHGAAIGLAIAFAGSFTPEPKAILIDLTMVDAKASSSTGAEKKNEKPGGAVKVKSTKKREKEKPVTVRKIVAEKPRHEEVENVPSKPKAPEVSELSHPVRLSEKTENASPISPANEAAHPDNGTLEGGSGSGTGTGHAGSGTSAGQLKSRYLREQFEYIKTLIDRNLVYPTKAKRMGWSGKVIVSFIILENGYVDDIKIASGSGYNLLDNNVIETIKKVQPFPKPPVRAEIKIPVTYRLDY